MKGFPGYYHSFAVSQSCMKVHFDKKSVVHIFQAGDEVWLLLSRF